MMPSDIILTGADKKEWRIKAPGEDFKYNVPVDLKTNKTINIGLDKVTNGSHYAVGYSESVSASGAAGLGASGAAEISVVNFTNKTYGGYNYSFAGLSSTASVGAQEGISAAGGVNFFVAVNTDAKNDFQMRPSTFEGETSSVGVSADLKAIVGGGFNVSGFSMTSGWKGISVGVSAGVGESVNAGSVNKGISNSKLLNSEIPTAKRSFADRYFNQQNPIATGIINYLTK
ncbi:hypothetical protein [Pedobacter nototheniae]|uniref:hypothetical protein n=1 Tax=Pedobacter nototheniae TaxID=2488994 RepID=UPI00103C82AB|nr:hypothetical protein [Pedobacter nototheniae]